MNSKNSYDELLIPRNVKFLSTKSRKPKFFNIRIEQLVETLPFGVSPSEIYYSDNNYAILKKLGEGAFGSVFKAYDLINEELVAIKFQKLSNDERSDANNTRLFEKEIVNLKAVSEVCKSLVCIKNYGKLPDKTYFIVMDYISGISLEDFINLKRNLNIEEITKIVKQIDKAIRAMHAKGMAHSDLKPVNIMIDQKTLEVRVVDLGLSCLDSFCGNGGTPVYMPHLFKGALEDRQIIDKWATALILIELIFSEDPELGFKISSSIYPALIMDRYIRYSNDPRFKLKANNKDFTSILTKYIKHGSEKLLKYYSFAGYEQPKLALKTPPPKYTSMKKKETVKKVKESIAKPKKEKGSIAKNKKNKSTAKKSDVQMIEVN